MRQPCAELIASVLLVPLGVLFLHRQEPPLLAEAGVRHNRQAMSVETDVLGAERQFFTALIAADGTALERLLADDFVLIDVMRGAEVSKQDLLAALGAGQVRFEAIEASDARVRMYGDAAVVTGRTEMRIRIGADSAAVRSRYTHVFARQDHEWRFVSAQGTQIAQE